MPLAGRRLTRHLIICINSFDRKTYAHQALQLVQHVHQELGYGGVRYSIVCGFGGCPADASTRIGKTVYAGITENLSDHNIFVCLHRARAWLPTDTACTCVMLHDTCMLKRGAFRHKMKQLSRLDVRGWVFAHSLGLYNMGACSLAFALDRAAVWDGIDHLTKAESIQLEHTRTGVVVQGKKNVPGLRQCTNCALSSVAHAGCGADDIDMHSITPVVVMGQTKHMVYLGGLGVYKLSHTPGSFLLPVWVPPYAPRTEAEYHAQTHDMHISAHAWVRPLVLHAFASLTDEDAAVVAAA